MSNCLLQRSLKMWMLAVWCSLTVIWYLLLVMMLLYELGTTALGSSSWHCLVTSVRSRLSYFITTQTSCSGELHMFYYECSLSVGMFSVGFLKTIFSLSMCVVILSHFHPPPVKTACCKTLRSIVMLCCHLLPCLPSSYFSSDFSIRILCAICVSGIHIRC